jgi:uncharacterized protein
MVKKEIYVSWQEFDDMAQTLIDKIKNCGQEFKGIYGVPRGGLPLAVYLSNHLELPLTYNEKPGIDDLVVDDISDKGSTLNKYKNNIIVCLYSSLWTTMPPDIYLRMKQSPDHWIYFPWESKNQITEKNNTDE